MLWVIPRTSTDAHNYTSVFLNQSLEEKMVQSLYHSTAVER